MITPLQQSGGARRYLLALAGLTVLTAGMFAVVQGSL
jgi:hypothetical protein